MTDLEKSYIAGIIDGEGCIYIGQRSPAIGRLNAQYVLGIAIGMTAEDFIYGLQRKIGYGSVYKECRKKLHHKDKFTLRFNAGDSIRLLSELREFLILKKQQADLLVEMSGLMNHRPNENKEKRRSIYNKIRCLNHRGTKNFISI